MPAGKIQVLYIDDKVANLSTFEETFREDYDLYFALFPNEAIGILEEKNIDVIIANQRTPKISGVQFLESIIDKYPDPVRIILTGHSDLDIVADAVTRGAIHYFITKPWAITEIKNCIEMVYEIRSLQKENKRMLGELQKVNAKIDLLKNYEKQDDAW